MHAQHMLICSISEQLLKWSVSCGPSSKHVHLFSPFPFLETSSACQMCKFLRQPADIVIRTHCQKVRMAYICNICIYSPQPYLCVDRSCYFSFYRGSSLLLGPKSIWTTWAGNAWIQYLHSSDHTVLTGHSFCPAIRRWCSQFCHHPLRGSVWLGAEQVWSAWPQRHQWWLLSS